MLTDCFPQLYRTQEGIVLKKFLKSFVVSLDRYAGKPGGNPGIERKALSYPSMWPFGFTKITFAFVLKKINKTGPLCLAVSYSRSLYRAQKALWENLKVKYWKGLEINQKRAWSWWPVVGTADKRGYIGK